MTIAIWCVLIAGIMPVAVAGLAKAGTRFDNRKPRESSEGLPGYHRLAHWAHLNCFEAFPFFAAAVIIADTHGGARPWLDGLAAAFIVVRILYVALYVSGRARFRSMAWAIAFLITIAIATLPAWR